MKIDLILQHSVTKKGKFRVLSCAVGIDASGGKTRPFKIRTLPKDYSSTTLHVVMQ